MEYAQKDVLAETEHYVMLLHTEDDNHNFCLASKVYDCIEVLGAGYGVTLLQLLELENFYVKATKSYEDYRNAVAKKTARILPAITH